MKYSAEQLAVIERVLAWWNDPDAPQRMTLGGYAGTGKTTVIKAIVGDVGDAEVAIVAFTGKAAFVLRTKGLPQATTLHKLIYQPGDVCIGCGRSPLSCAATNEQNRLALQRKPGQTRKYPICPGGGTRISWARKPKLLAKLIIVDEASMLSSRLVRDLEDFGTKVLYVGDHGQLEPVGDDPRMMAEPQLRLEKIHRQAEGSSIIRFAHELRRGALPQYFRSDDHVRIHHGMPRDVARFDVVLCGFNKTRVAVNARIRERRGFRGVLPQPGERVICLKNNAERGLFNGMQGTVTEMKPSGRMSVVDDVGTEYTNMAVATEQFGQESTMRLDRDDEDTTLWDYGYCMTVHKSQGSEWDSVCVLEQLAKIWSPARWRYTAVTRAAQSVTYCNR